MTTRSDDAVSPVVGVMLMLAVTIIIAAVVSAFAGGMSESNSKAPNVQIKGYYSQSQGMWIENNGPDEISTMNTQVLVRLSDSFGNAQHQVWTVNKTSITNATSYSSTTNLDKGRWLREGGYTGTKSFKPGERAYVLPPYHSSAFLQPDASSTYSISSPDNLGNSFWIELTDKSGTVFAKTKVKIEP